MTKKIESLTQEQIDKFPQYVDEFLKIGLSTDRADRPRAEELIDLAYTQVGLAKPKTKIWFDSPHVAEKYISDVLGVAPARMYNNHNAEWYSYNDFFRRELPLKKSKEMDQLAVLIDLARTCGWLYMYDTICIATERPTEIHFDFEKRTHNDKGFAIKYADGNGVAVYHGVRIPNEWVLGNPPSAAKALSWPQIEQRRAACELFGWKNILKQLNSRVINTDVDPLIGELIECDLPDSPNEKFLRVMCGTGREFVLSVPKEMKTALEANAWTYGIPSDMLTKKFVRT